MNKIKLKFKIKEDGLFILGNENGLRHLSRLLEEIAGGQEFHHSHIGFRWKERLNTGEVIIEIDEGKSTKNDVTIIKTEKIGDELWNAQED